MLPARERAEELLREAEARNPGSWGNHSRVAAHCAERMEDIRRRYGGYPQAKWDTNLALKRYFENKAGRDIYDVVDREHFQL